MTQIATLIFVFGILGLIVLDPERKARTSKALWLPVAWLLIAGSRPMSMWLDMGPATSAERYMEGSPLDRNIYSVLLAAGIVVLLGRRTAVASFVRANWPILLFVLYCALSIIWSDYPGVAFKRWVKSLGDYVMVLIVLTDRERSAAVKQVLARVGAILLPLSILFAKYYPDLGRAYSRYEGTQYTTGVAQDKNMLGMACLVFGLAASWQVMHEYCGSRRFRTLIVHGTILVMAIWLLAKANSVTSLACFLMANGLIAAHAFSKIGRKRAVVHLLVAGVLAASFCALFLDLGGGVLETMGRDSTLTGRTLIWQDVLAVPLNPVVGTGFESFWLGTRLENLWALPGMRYINEAHNGFLEVYLNLGWAGLCLVAVLIITGYRNVLRLLEHDPEAGRLRLGYLVVAVVYNYSEAGIRTADLVWIAFLLAIIALPTARAPEAAAEVAGSRSDIAGSPFEAAWHEQPVLNSN